MRPLNPSFWQVPSATRPSGTFPLTPLRLTFNRKNSAFASSERPDSLDEFDLFAEVASWRKRGLTERAAASIPRHACWPELPFAAAGPELAGQYALSTSYTCHEAQEAPRPSTADRVAFTVARADQTTGKQAATQL